MELTADYTTYSAHFPKPFAGVDEAGRGCLAGPVVAGAVILPEDFVLPGLTDSKKLSAKERVTLEQAIKSCAVSFGLGIVWPGEIDRINILQATFMAMAKAVKALRVPVRFLAVDGNKTIPFCSSPQEAVVGGDGKIAAIAAAGILAKTFRDRLMQVYDRHYPGYGFAKHKGYATALHVAAIRELGPSVIHRLTFRKVQPEAKKEEQPCLPGI